MEKDNWQVQLYAENVFNDDDIILNIGAVNLNPYVSLTSRTLDVRFQQWFD